MSKRACRWAASRGRYSPLEPSLSAAPPAAQLGAQTQLRCAALCCAVACHRRMASGRRRHGVQNCHAASPRAPPARPTLQQGLHLLQGHQDVRGRPQGGRRVALLQDLPVHGRPALPGQLLPLPIGCAGGSAGTACRLLRGAAACVVNRAAPAPTLPNRCPHPPPPCGRHGNVRQVHEARHPQAGHARVLRAGAVRGWQRHRRRRQLRVPRTCGRGATAV